MSLHLVAHPLARHLMTVLRDTRTPASAFRVAAAQLTTLVALEATRDLALATRRIETPLEPMDGEVLASPLVVVPILRAGLGMLGPVLDLYPDASVGHIGLARDEASAVAEAYYCKLPALDHAPVLIVDPMLATGGSACQAIDAVRAAGGRDIRVLCIVAAPEGVARVAASHPDVRIFGVALDRALDPRKYIVPGLGDFGDRLFGTL